MASDDRRLRSLIVRSRVFDPALKRAWLRVLPHMSETQRRELAEILRLEGAAEPTGRRDPAGRRDPSRR